MFDSLFFIVFKHYKNLKVKKANQFATIYISILQCLILLLLGMFFAGFFNQMNLNTLSQDKVWILFAMASIFIFFKNWIQYAGRKRKVLNAKMLSKKSQKYPAYMLYLLPVACFVLSIILWQAV
ncbi:hypothetical protein [Bizionia argentinensis]|nr:hypothetical protein [Bizionia argentinensis]